MHAQSVLAAMSATQNSLFKSPSCSHCFFTQEYLLANVTIQAATRRKQTLLTKHQATCLTKRIRYKRHVNDL
jgi:hypothetical protein